MVRKRKATPQRASESKRQVMSWNMIDLTPDPEFTIVADDDPALLLEKNPQISSTLASSTKTTVQNAEQIQAMIDTCQFYVRIDKLGAKLNHDYWRCELGEFSISGIENELADDVEAFWLYINAETSEHGLYYEIESSEASSSTSSDLERTKQAKCISVRTTLPQKFFKGLTMNCFNLVLKSDKMLGGELTVGVYMLKGGLTRIDFASDGSSQRKVHIAIQGLVGYFYGIKPPELGPNPFSQKHDIDQLYGVVKEKHELSPTSLHVNVQHEHLRPRLREYQREAVLWMLCRENMAAKGQRSSDKEYDPDRCRVRNGETAREVGLINDEEEKIHPLYQQLVTKDGQTLYYNKYGGYLVNEKPLYRSSPPGGILADEMGLGKTVEVLACLMLHPRKDLPQIEPLATVLEEEDEEEENGATQDDGNGNLAIPGTSRSNPFSRSQSEPALIEHSEEKGEMVLVEGCDVTESIVEQTALSVSPECAQIKEKEGNCEKDVVLDDSNGIVLELNEESNQDAQLKDNGQNSCARTWTIEKDTKVEEEGLHVESSCALLDHSYGSGKAEDIMDGKMEDIVDGQNEDIKDGKAKGISDGKAEDIMDGQAKAIVNGTDGGNGDGMDHAKGASHDVESEACKCEDELMKDVNADHIDDSGKKELEIKNEAEVSTPTAKKRGRRRSSTKGKKEKNAATKETPKKRQSRKSKSVSGDVTLFKPEPIVVERDEMFECICGSQIKARDGKGREAISVECRMCHLSQHALCVNYDLRDSMRGEYKCPHCHAASVPFPSGATLIISPSSICHQWYTEIKKHIHKEKVTVFIYTGVSNQGYIQPRTLAKHDIVITTYETLQKELNYVDLPHTKSDAGRRFRNPKRFMALPSPLVAVQWWRICLDEAQMVENTTTKTAEMALRLSAVNRWCVTGTPVQKSIDDLYGLLLFLGMDPYWVRAWWSSLLYKPYCHGNRQPLQEVMSKVMWRTAKQDVLNQICIPLQTEEMHLLTFSPVEEHFYRRQYQDCARDAMARLRKWTDSDMKLSSLDRQTLHQLLYPLIRLRQACCHPQAVKGAFLPLHKSTLTMEELLEQLTKKARLECEEAHRQCVFAMNGLAALHVLKEQYIEAVDVYRDVLRAIQEHGEKVRTDPLQQLHTLHNLHDVITAYGDEAKIPPTLRDGQLPQQIAELKKQYLTKASRIVNQWQEAWNPHKTTLRELQIQFQGGEDWWQQGIGWVVTVHQEENFILRVKEDLEDNSNPQLQNMARRFRDVHGLEYLIATQLDALSASHTKLIKAISTLSRKPGRDLIKKTVECCLRPDNLPLKNCPFCDADSLFDDYEGKLFSFVEKGISDDGPDGLLPSVSTKRQGTWADSDTERALKAMLSYIRTQPLPDREILENANRHLKILDTMKKEFKCVRTLWIELKAQVSSIDELDMATMRLRLRLPDEPKADPPQPNVIEKAEIDHHRMKFLSDRTIGKNELSKKLGQLLYLKNLAKTQDSLEGGINPEPCPICQKQLAKKWSVLQCGHCYCLECIRILVDEYSFGGTHQSLKCPVCRQKTKHAEISYVCTKGNNATEDEQDINVKGDNSTKVEGIVRCLLKIAAQEPGAKALVFSTWTDVLDLLSSALEENNISYRALHAPGKFQASLSQFQSDASISVLLLPVHSGANGLNLIEATHVLLVEPLLNPAQELQAIGRVHRIGQTRPTVVHRFLVRGSIEEKMHSLVQSVARPLNSHRAEETNLTIGDLSTLFRDSEGAMDTEGEESDEEEGEEGRGREGGGRDERSRE